MRNQNNETFYLSHEAVFNLYGSKLREHLCNFVMAPLNMLGVFANLVTLAVLSNKKFSSKGLYTYFIVHTINSLLINLLQCFESIALNFRTFEFTYKASYSGYFQSFVYIPLLNLLVLYGIILEVCVTIERNSQFSAKFKCLVKYRARNVCIILFLICFAINFSHFFVGRPAVFKHKLNSTEILEIHFFKVTNFSKSLPGMTINSLVYLFRDIILFIVQIVLNIMTIYLLREHLKNKKNILTKKRTDKNDTRGLPLRKESRSIKIKHSKKKPFITKVDKNMTIMVVIMALVTAMEHIFLLLMIYSVTLNENNTSFLIAVISCIFISIKNLSNFFLYFSFNKIFRSELIKKIKWN